MVIYPNSFLETLMQQRHRTIYARITALQMDERPLETIEGRITSGSINIDGNSAVRRTCQLSMVSDTVNISDYLWGLDTKFKLEIGIENQINKNYPDIIWFKQGVYIITSFSAALSPTGYTINLSGKDKMCLLNGENGGNLPFEVDFGTYTQTDKNGNTKIIKNPLKDIIREAVYHYGGEPFHNIIINDLDNIGRELLEYKLDIPLYLLRQKGSNIYEQGTLNGDMKVLVNEEPTIISQLENYISFIGEDFGGEQIDPTLFTLEGDDSTEYEAAKISYGETMGYIPTEMVYTGDLIASIGETITSVLDKIKKMLGNYEYFYDLDGRFVFQQQKNYLNTSWSPIQTTENNLTYVDAFAEKIQFSFINGELFTAFNNTPNLSNLKNDFSVWGTRKSATGKELPIHMRYAIDIKPIIYSTIEVTDEELRDYNQKYGFNLEGQQSKIYVSNEYTNDIVYNKEMNTLQIYLPSFKVEEMIMKDLGLLTTSYNADTRTLTIHNVSSVDSYVDWRELIYQMAKDYRRYNHLDNFAQKVATANSGLYSNGITGYEQYYIDIEGFWRQLYSPEAESEEYYSEGQNKYWNKAVYENPETLNFWFDFLDTHGELLEYSVKNIGDRTKVVNDKDVKAIYYRETPETTYASPGSDFTNTSNIQIPENYKGMFSQSTQGKSAKDMVDSLLYNHAYCVESVSITSIPIYYLEPNKRIYIADENTGIQGEYIPTQFTIPLTYNGTMSITATKAVDRII